MFDVSVPGGDANNPGPSSVAGSLLASVVTSEDDRLMAGVLVEMCVQASDRNCSIFRAATIVATVRTLAAWFARIVIDKTTHAPAAMVEAIADATITSRSAKPGTCREREE